MSQQNRPPNRNKSAQQQRSAGGQSRPGANRPSGARSSPAPRQRTAPPPPPNTSIQRYVAIALLAVVVIAGVLFFVLQGQGNKSGSSLGATTGGSTGASAPTGGNKYLVIETTKGRIVAQLYTDPSAKVTNTIANFEQKANSGYYNGLTFHRVEDWVIQGGDPKGTGSGGGTMPSEYNSISFKRGALGVARGQDPTINNDSQFFITKTDSPHLDGQYTNWGQVTEGMDVVDKIAIGDKMTKVTVENK